MHKSASQSRRNLLQRFNLEIRENMSKRNQALVICGGLGIGLLVSAVILMFVGISASDLLNEFIFSIFTSSRSINAVLALTAPLTIVGLSAAIGFKARFWNIGIEGQVIFGAIGATLIATYDVGPEQFRIYLMASMAMLFGMAWMILPLFLSVKLRVNEIISTLLLNYVAFNFLLHLLYGPWKDPETFFPNSKIYEKSERLNNVMGLEINVSVVIALVFVVLMTWLLSLSRFGYILKFVYANSNMAKSIGINVVLMVSIAALISGALSGLAGFTISAGIDSRLTQGFFIGYGFLGILIGFLARNNPILVVIFALMMAILMVAGQSLQVFYQIPFAMIQLIQAIIVICVAASEFFIQHRINIIK
jgi:general nucleoside transport system permease protein